MFRKRWEVRTKLYADGQWSRWYGPHKFRFKWRATLFTWGYRGLSAKDLGVMTEITRAP